GCSTPRRRRPPGARPGPIAVAAGCPRASPALNVCGIRLGPAQPCVLPRLGSRPGATAAIKSARASVGRALRTRLQALLDEGVASGVFPCAWAVVRRDGEVVFEGGAGGATARTVFDLASLTKAMCTTTAFLALWAEGKVEPETPVTRYFPHSGTGRAGGTVADLLYHRSGLPAFA